jgi:hypothetical protein
MTHDRVEDWLLQRGRELMRQLMRDHADLRAVRELRRDGVVGSDGVVRTRVESGHARGLTTVFGPVTVERIAYRAPGSANLHPSDAVWNMPVGLHSHGLARLAVREAVRGSFDEARTAVERATGAVMGKRQLENRVAAAAVDVAGFYAARRPAPTGPDTLLVLSCDGKGVHDAARGAARGHGESCRQDDEGRRAILPARARQPDAHGRDRVRLRHRTRPAHPRRRRRRGRRVLRRP